MPSVAIRAPELKLIAAVPTSAGRVLELLIRPAPGTYSIRIWAVDMPVLSAEVDGHSIDAGRYRTPLIAMDTQLCRSSGQGIYTQAHGATAIRPWGSI